jgi:hypothetical protein
MASAPVAAARSSRCDRPGLAMMSMTTRAVVNTESGTGTSEPRSFPIEVAFTRICGRTDAASGT